ncbi:1-acyl-sn-glycerol-3-phosphate acyltransferase [Arthrobacter sp.]|uniref:lysophospholipid acyltransferase family protein n=1 Tax=Arthrobacter sp. TaxID=1667 RepID=UPI003393FADA
MLDHLVYRTRIHGREHVPAGGPFIFAANHLSYPFGPVTVGAAPRPMHVLVQQEMFTGFLGALLQYSGQIPVDRSGGRAASATPRRCWTRAAASESCPRAAEALGTLPRSAPEWPGWP